MAGKSAYWKNKTLDIIFSAASFTPPATLYFALFTSGPNESGVGTEVSGGSYVRKAVTNNGTNFGSAVAGVKRNATAITWVTPSASWGTVVGLGVFDASSGGNMFYGGPTSPSFVVSSGVAPSLDINAMMASDL